METLRILQIGDIHLPEWQETKSDVDHKDKEFSEEISDDISLGRLRSVLRRLHDISTRSHIDCVALMGDLTSFGEIQQIQPAIDIIDALVTGPEGHKPLMMTVPGNHDIDKDEAALLGKSGKFRSLVAAVENRRWLRPPTDDCLRYPLGPRAGGPSIDCLLLNTSIGSWSPHLLPPGLAREYETEALAAAPIQLAKEAVADIANTPGWTESVLRNRTEQRFRQMDTPYVSKRSLATLSDKLRDLAGGAAIVMAHHNLLPQRVPRLLAYGEMLNAGFLRQMLHASNRNVIYLHGHLHEDPVEVISVPSTEIASRSERKIVSIAAPALKDGFNEITLFFGAENDVFLVRVTKYRPNPFHVVGNFSDQDTQYIPLRRHVGDLITGASRGVWQLIKDQRTTNWHQLRADIAGTRLQISDDDLELVLLKLFCCGLVRISQLGRDRMKWGLECVD